MPVPALANWPLIRFGVVYIAHHCFYANFIRGNIYTPLRLFDVAIGKVVETEAWLDEYPVFQPERKPKPQFRKGVDTGANYIVGVNDSGVIFHEAISNPCCQAVGYLQVF